MTPSSRLWLPLALTASLLSASTLLAQSPEQSPVQSPAERVRAIQLQHEDSLPDLCRAFDAELLRALPPWSDPAFRWALFGVPTDTERERLRTDARNLAALLSAMQPVIDERLREADRTNQRGIEEAVQLGTVLMPLARARGLLLYAVAVDPAIGSTDESLRALEQAQRIALQAESVSAWSAAERALIIAAASLRLNQPEPAIESIRTLRDAMREDPLLTEQIAGLARTRAALETLLVATARSPVEARDSMPEDPADAQRLRLRLAAIAAASASTPDEHARLLSVEADRLANLALDLARDNRFDDPSWVEQIERCEALLNGANPTRLSQTAQATLRIAGATRSTDPDATLEGRDLGPLTLLALTVQLRAINHEDTDLIAPERLAQLGLGFDRLASDTVLGESALEQIGLLLRVHLSQPVQDASEAERDRLRDLTEVLAARPNASRSNLDLLGAVMQGGPVERASTLLEIARRTGAADEDARLALGNSANILLDRLVRNQINAVLDQPTISPEEEQHIIDLLARLADPYERAGGETARLTMMRAAALSDPQADLAALRAIKPAPSSNWIHEVLTTRAALLAGQPLADPVTDNTVFAAAIFASRDLPQDLDIRGTIPASDRTIPAAQSAIEAGTVLSQRSGVYTRLAILAFSAALHTDDEETLKRLAAEAEQARARVEHPADRAWLSIIGAEAAMRSDDDAKAFGTYRDLVATTPVEDRGTRAYWHASMRMLEILARQNADGSRTPAIAREIRRLKLQPSWGAHEDIRARIERLTSELLNENDR